MLRTAVFPGRYLQGDGALLQLGEEMARLGRRPLLLAGGSAFASIIPERAPVWERSVGPRYERFGGQCCLAEIGRLQDLARAEAADMIVGLGGGKVIDTAKAVADALRLPVAIAPTIASTDAPTSQTAVVYRDDGAVETYLFQKRNPDVVLVDTGVIARAPVRFLVAGMGDALSTWLEADSCVKAFALNQCGGHSTRAGLALARLCYDILLEQGVTAKLSCEAQVVTPALEQVVEANTLLSGLGFESAGLASAHAIHNGLTLIPRARKFFHGEKVAFGALAGLFLCDRPRALVDEVYAFCESVGLPTCLADLDLGDIGAEELAAVGRRACAPDETIHHEPFPVAPGQVAAALVAADRYGRRRRGENGKNAAGSGA